VIDNCISSTIKLHVNFTVTVFTYFLVISLSPLKIYMFCFLYYRIVYICSFCWFILSVVGYFGKPVVCIYYCLSCHTICVVIYFVNNQFFDSSIQFSFSSLTFLINFKCFVFIFLMLWWLFVPF